MSIHKYIRPDDQKESSCSEEPGFYFGPSDEDLVGYYLVKKVHNSNSVFKAIGVVDFNKYEPWDLPAMAKTHQKEFYFFTRKDKKYTTGVRTNRATQAGFWKATGKDRDIGLESTGRLTGFKKTLVFYIGRAPKGQKTNWIMHEYRLDGNSRPDEDLDWVVCRVFEKSSSMKMTAPGFKVPKPDSDFGFSVKSSNASESHSSLLPDLQSPESVKFSAFNAVSSNVSEAQSNFLPDLQSLESPKFQAVKPNNYSLSGIQNLDDTRGYSPGVTYPRQETPSCQHSNAFTLENLIASWDIPSPDFLRFLQSDVP